MIRSGLATITNRQSYADVIECISDLDGTPFDLTGATAKVSLMEKGWVPPSGLFGPWYDNARAPIRLDATVLIYETAGVISFTFTAAQIATLCPGQYALACTLTRAETTVQLLLGDLSVLFGLVPQ